MSYEFERDGCLALSLTRIRWTLDFHIEGLTNLYSLAKSDSYLCLNYTSDKMSFRFNKIANYLYKTHSLCLNSIFYISLSTF